MKDTFLAMRAKAHEKKDTARMMKRPPTWRGRLYSSRLAPPPPQVERLAGREAGTRTASSRVSAEVSYRLKAI
jgi:hypothetical protein